ncbi:ribonucleotide reductase inhibitor-domain-containing protein [Mariannaea sp. PMI_226]|nr:ribonucleotide reductase inhibitor-domain-containing protein [Mariannaea sp. PMI_226]
MSTPRTKRQFAGASADPAQRQITSFFNKSTTADTPNGTISRQPELPDSVQANLLSVGMRVRKSVPEGYKTVGPSGFKIWTDNSAVPATSTTTLSFIARPPTKALSRELLPFCGINKVGGLDTQPEFQHDSFDDIPELDSIPELTSSQESTDSIEPSASSRKRIFDEDIGEADGYPETFSGSLSLGNGRAMAVPRSRGKHGVPFKGIGRANMSANNDFADAEFLVYDDEGEMDMADE